MHMISLSRLFLNEFSDFADMTLFGNAFQLSTILKVKKFRRNSKFALLLNNLRLLPRSLFSASGSLGDTSTSKSSCNILYVMIISPLIRLKTRDGRSKYLNLFWYVK